MESAPLLPFLPTSRTFSYALDYFKKTVEYDQLVNVILQREKEEDRKSYVRKMVLSFIRERGYEKEQIQQTWNDFRSRWCPPCDYEQWVLTESDETIQQECVQFFKNFIIL